MTNYDFFYPTGSDLMSNVETNLTDNWEKIENRNDITVIAAGAALPQSGSYNVGDRVFRNDAAAGNTWPSNYLLISKDTDWGWHWRPIQQIISPWVTVPSTAIADASFQQHPTAPLQVALDSRGFCMWRGAIRKTAAGITANQSFTILKPLPTGIRPNNNITHTVALTPVVSGTGKPGNVSGRIGVNTDGTSSFRFANSNNGTTQDIWLDGLLYNNSTGYFFGA
jgi:hypothetical protein